MTALAKRFRHLDYGQRNEIFHAIDKGIAPVEGLTNLTAEWKNRHATILARKYGVPRAVVIDVYEHLATKRYERQRN